MAVGTLDAVMPLGIKIYMELFLDKANLQAFAIKMPGLLAFLEVPLAALRDKLANENATWLIPLAIIGFTLIQGLLSYVALYFNTYVSAHVSARVKRDVYAQLLRFETAYYDTTESGEILYRANNDVDLACNTLIQTLKQSLTRALSVVALSITLLSLSWKLAIVALLVLGSTVIPLSFTRRYLKTISQQGVVYAGNLATHITESCQGNRVIAAYNLKNHQVEGLRKVLRQVNRMALKTAGIQGLITPLMHTIAGLGIGLVLWFGTQLISTGEISLGSFAAFLTSLVLLYTPVKSLGNMSVTLHLAILALERVLLLLERKPLLDSKSDSVVLQGLGSGVSFERVSFRYKPEAPFVLKEFSLSLRPGQTVALVGSSGSGKTTLAHLLLRLYDVTEGAIRVDGLDIRDVELASLRQQMAAVFQDNFVFKGTIRENILLARPDATEAEVWDVLRAAYLETFVKSLDKGLDTEIGERGISLSGGQRQRLAIARALLKNAPLVLLDEATSALDNQSEAMVQKALDELMQDRTVLVIAHRLSTIQNADRIVVLQQGQIVEEGTHEELLARHGVYLALYQAQFSQRSETTPQQTEEVAAPSLTDAALAMGA